MKGRFLIGTVAIWFRKMHWRFEIIPFAKKHGISREQMKAATMARAEKNFDSDWPAPEVHEKSTPKGETP